MKPAPAPRALDSKPGEGLRAGAVSAVVEKILAGPSGDPLADWLGVVGRRVSSARPDLSARLLEALGVPAADEDLLHGLTIGEVGVCYEALLAALDTGARKKAGQFFTPDDVAAFMASRAALFPEGVWLDPCCGVGNLSWHLAQAQDDPARFVAERLILVDADEVALKTAVALIAAEHVGEGDLDGFEAFFERCVARDFLCGDPVPEHDFVLMNPPYAAGQAPEGFATSKTKELFAFFLERATSTSSGLVAVTPAAYLSAAKFAPVRQMLDETMSGGEVLVFDNVPDTLFRGYKFGSSNTSTTNFVRAAITVCSPVMTGWKVSPIVRWKAVSRQRMLSGCVDLLAERTVGPHGEWAKIFPEHRQAWEHLRGLPETVASLVSPSPTPYHLTVGMTPRYYISAAFRDLERGSKTTLFFPDAQTRDRVAVALNSSVPYLWWRALDGGVTLPRRVLMSTPVPPSTPDTAELARALEAEEGSCVTVKMNAGKPNENVKRPRETVEQMNRECFPGIEFDVRRLYSEDMFSA